MRLNIDDFNKLDMEICWSPAKVAEFFSSAGDACLSVEKLTKHFIDANAGDLLDLAWVLFQVAYKRAHKAYLRYAATYNSTELLRWLREYGEPPRFGGLWNLLIKANCDNAEIGCRLLWLARLIDNE